MKGIGGYLLVDHRASPGLPEEIARMAGYDPRLCREGKVFESRTMTCAHCRGSVVPHPARTRARASCLQCDNREGAYICDACDFERNQPDYVHKPFVQVIEEIKCQLMGTPPELLT